MDYKTHITGVFDRAAILYGKFGNHHFNHFAERLIFHAPAFPGAQVLDIATGRGALLQHLIPQVGKEGKIIGIDISPEMIAQTRLFFQRENVELHCMDAEHLPFSEHAFDRIYCGFGLMFFPNLKKTLQEWKRVLKPGGKIAVSTFGSSGWTRQIMAEKLRHLGINPQVVLHPLQTEESLRALFDPEGFSSLTIIPDRLDHVFTNFDHWWECLFGHASRSALEQLTFTQMSQLREELIDALSAANRSDGFHEEYHAWYTIAST